MARYASFFKDGKELPYILYTETVLRPAVEERTMQIQRRRKGVENIADFRVGYVEPEDLAAALEAGAEGERLVILRRPAAMSERR